MRGRAQGPWGPWMSPQQSSEAEPGPVVWQGCPNARNPAPGAQRGALAGQNRCEYTQPGRCLGLGLPLHSSQLGGGESLPGPLSCPGLRTLTGQGCWARGKPGGGRSPPRLHTVPPYISQSPRQRYRGPASFAEAWLHPPPLGFHVHVCGSSARKFTLCLCSSPPPAVTLWPPSGQGG